jgi:hypothetical protein
MNPTIQQSKRLRRSFSEGAQSNNPSAFAVASAKEHNPFFLTFDQMRLIILFFLLVTSNLWSQDTINVYFEFGSSKMNSEFHSRIGDISSDYDLSTIDSIQFIGYTDSIGKWSANVRLSEKRAKNVYRHSKLSVEKGLHYSIFARGEGTRDDASLNRRVEIILFYAPEAPVIPDEVLVNVDPRCFSIDFEALEYSHTRTIRKKRKELIYIEALVVDLFKERTHYYVKKNTKGELDIQRVKWKIKKTGMLWWKKSRYVTQIPKKSFDKFHFFTLTDGPCDGCKEDILTKDTLILNIEEFYPDLFLLHNAQTRMKLFGKFDLRARVPREYIDRSDSYFYSSSDHDRIGNTEFQWKTKRGRRRQNYYYADLPILGDRFPWIKRERMTTICTNDYDGSGINNVPFCGGVRGSRIELQFDLETGVFLQNNDPTAFLAGGLSYTSSRSYTTLLAGINSHFGLYGSARYQFHYLSFPFAALKPVNAWQTLSERKEITTYGRLLFGAEVKTSFNKDYQSFMEGNLHLGLTLVNTNERNFIPRIYVYGGIAKDFINHANLKPYPFVQAGLIFNFNAFFD